MTPSAPRAESWIARLKGMLGLGVSDGAGARGEREAEAFLRDERAFTTITRNWRNPKDRREEIDLVMRDGEVLVFVEVKARAAGALVSGYHAVNSSKKKIMRRACAAYLRALADKPRTFRFDIVEVTLLANALQSDRKPSEPSVRHYENVALFPKQFQV